MAEVISMPARHRRPDDKMRELESLKPKHKRTPTQRQLEGLLLHRRVQRSNLNAVIAGIERRLREMGVKPHSHG